MSTDQDIKSQLSKHINSKLFKRFWDKETTKLETPHPGRSLKIPQHYSPFKPRRSLDYSSDEEPVNPHLSKSISQRSRDFISYSRQGSPLKNPFNYQDDFYDTNPDLLSNRVSWKDTEESLRTAPYYKVISPEVVRVYEETQTKLKNDLIMVKEKYEGIVQKKNSEIKRLQKSQEVLKKQIGDLNERIGELEEGGKKMEGVKVSYEALQRKVVQVEAECEGFRRQLDYTRETCETYRNQIEDYERNLRSHTQDSTADLKFYKDRTDELERLLTREKHKNSDLERKFSKSKDRIFTLETDLSRCEDRNKRLEREIQDTKDRLSRESSQQLRETEFLRRKIEDLTQEVLKNSNGSYTSPRKSEYIDRNPFNRTFVEEYREESPVFRKSTTVDRKQFSDRRHEADNWRMKEILSPKSSPPESSKALENKLMNMQLEKKRLEDDLAKIPQQGRRLAQIKRQEEIELELEVLNSNISALKGRLRQFNIF